MNDLVALLANTPDVTNAIAAVCSAVAGLLSVIVACLAVYISHITLKHQRRHNILSVRPIPIVTVADFEDSIRVKIRNHGFGPLLINKVFVKGGRDGSEMKDALVKWMPALPDGLSWTNFSGAVVDRSVLPGSEIMLLELRGNCEDTDFCKTRDRIRVALAPLGVVVDYTDIYESAFKQYEKKLDWFGRPEGERY